MCITQITSYLINYYTYWGRFCIALLTPTIRFQYIHFITSHQTTITSHHITLHPTTITSHYAHIILYHNVSCPYHISHHKCPLGVPFSVCDCCEFLSCCCWCCCCCCCCCCYFCCCCCCCCCRCCCCFCCNTGLLAYALPVHWYSWFSTIKS